MDKYILLYLITTTYISVFYTLKPYGTVLGYMGTDTKYIRSNMVFGN